MKICIVSDSHDRAEPLLAAATRAQREGARALIHCGDLIGTNTLRPLLALGLPIHLVHGNNLGDPVALPRMAALSNGLVSYHGNDLDIRLGGRRIFATHFPHLARGMACTGDYDLVCCGHSHEASIARQIHIGGGEAWLVNPGTVAGVGGEPCWIFGDLEAMSFELRRG